MSVIFVCVVRRFRWLWMRITCARSSCTHHPATHRQREGRGIARAHGVPRQVTSHIPLPLCMVCFLFLRLVCWCSDSSLLHFVWVCVCVCRVCSHGRFTNSAYVCPRCASRCCELPGECAVCGVMLILSSHLARSYHHLFPLPAFAPPTGDTMCVLCL